MRSIVLIAAAALLASCASAPDKKQTLVKTEEPTDMNINEEVVTFLADQTKELEPLAKASNLAWYEASISGKDEDWDKSKKAEDALNRYFSNSELFAKVKGYRDPGQDLNALWWKMVEQYQLLKRPPNRNAPDYASKIHFVVVPVYYHNYQMGVLFLSQLHEAIAKLENKEPLTAVYVGETKVGEFLKTEVFAVGARFPWNELTQRLTGAPLSAEAFARRFSAR